jgi:hypothetical protein
MPKKEEQTNKPKEWVAKKGKVSGRVAKKGENDDKLEEYTSKKRGKGYLLAEMFG